jgi:hypothetical protein
MTLFHFLGLDIDRQAAFACRGDYLATRMDGEQQVLLYRTGDFFAEIFFDTLKWKIVLVKGFNARSHLAAYHVSQ